LTSSERFRIGAELLDGRFWEFEGALYRDDTASIDVVAIDTRTAESPKRTELQWRPREEFPLALLSDPTAFHQLVGSSLERVCEVWILALRNAWQRRETRNELLDLRQCFDEWKSRPGRQRSGPAAAELVEEPLRTFFAKAAPEGVKVGKGDRPAVDPRYSSDMDIVFDFERAQWRARFRLNVHASPVLAHLDVGARTDWDDKLKDDLARVQRTIDEAAAHGTKTWTGLVCVGPAYVGRIDEISRTVHDLHHSQNLHMQGVGGVDEHWPFVDAIVLPGMLLKKHDLFAAPERKSKRWPVLYPFPVGDDTGLGELWPLATARAFLSSYLRKALGREPWDAPAWRDWEFDSITGGGRPIGPWPKGWSVIALRDDTPRELFHWTGDAKPSWQDHVLSAQPRCADRASYALLPRLKCGSVIASSSG
jgi:hypothetical protein